MADISKVTTVDGTTYNIKDAGVPSWARGASKPTYTASEVGAVAKTGDTMSGGLSVQASDAIVAVKSTSKLQELQLGSWSNGTQGLLSTGYNSGSALVTTEKWLIYRDTDGNVNVSDHYNKAEVDGKLANFTIYRVQKTVTIPSGTDGMTDTAIDLTNELPSGMRIYDAISVWLRGYRLPYIETGVIKTWVTTVRAKEVWIGNLSGAWSNYVLYVTLLIYPE